MASGWMIAAAGWMFAWFNSKTQEERKARIERVNEQLRDFYGPLLACVTATKSAYDAMVKQHSPNGSAAAFQERCIHDPTGPEAKAYRVWMDKVLQPLNEKAASIIAEHIDLLDAQHVVPELLQVGFAQKQQDASILYASDVTQVTSPGAHAYASCR
eukprot:GHRR01008546.1.p1 GENE.GHRR01008546.1~~GHRR01008546.1.p1  ORF type:complete len:157 (+),score=52.66 GHRR01008546.1:1428-1898(+)